MTNKKELYYELALIVNQKMYDLEYISEYNYQKVLKYLTKYLRDNYGFNLDQKRT